MAVTGSGAGSDARGESRWPMASAVLGTGVLHALLPSQVVVNPPWIYLAGTSVLLLALVVGDPGRIDRDRETLRVLTGVLIALVTLANLVVGLRIVVGILADQPLWNSAPELLLAGGICWVTNVVAFGLWFWDLDRGGPAARAHGRGSPAFVFPEMVNHGLVRQAWYPAFVDYLALSFNTATAFSPTDVSAIRPWAKLLMIVEAMMSLGLAGLVIARAVNVLN